MDYVLRKFRAAYNSKHFITYALIIWFVSVIILSSLSRYHKNHCTSLQGSQDPENPCYEAKKTSGTNWIPKNYSKLAQLDLKNTMSSNDIETSEKNKNNVKQNSEMNTVDAIAYTKATFEAVAVENEKEDEKVEYKTNTKPGMANNMGMTDEKENPDFKLQNKNNFTTYEEGKEYFKAKRKNKYELENALKYKSEEELNLKLDKEKYIDTLNDFDNKTENFTDFFMLLMGMMNVTLNITI